MGKGINIVPKHPENFEQFFLEVVGQQPYPYQRKLAEEPWPDLLDIPTGLGKTAAVTIAWLYKRLTSDTNTPRRLVWCLPMRVLVEQTKRNVEAWLAASAKFFEAQGLTPPKAWMLMGGETESGWVEQPEEAAILIGTQDMLLSRALMRGYGMSRYQWPVHFALLHNDAFWIFDEIQLMGSGLATSAQLEAFRRGLKLGKNSQSLWVSATLNPEWLMTVDFGVYCSSLKRQKLTPTEKKLPAVQTRREAVKRLSAAATQLNRESARGGAKAYADALTQEIISQHRSGSTTLIVLNTVERAQALAQGLEGNTEAELMLVHARFRAAERRELEALFATEPGEAGRIIIATQAIEAGVDISSRILFTELAPWASLVQRFGRCNRYGEWNEHGGADVFWIDAQPDSQLEPPYDAEALKVARNRLLTLHDASPAALPATDQAAPESLLLRRRDLLELFNTDADLSGFDIDISPFIRDSEETDLQVFWRDIAHDAKSRPQLDAQPRPQAEELCRVSIGQFDAYLQRIKRQQGQAYAWDPLIGRWIILDGRLRPGLIVMLDARLGGYDPKLGFLARLREQVPTLPPPATEVRPPEDSSDPRSFTGRAVALDEHLTNVETAAKTLCSALEMTVEAARPVVQAARWHDVGKAHPAFQNMLQASMTRAHSAQAAFWAKSSRRSAGRVRYFLFDQKGQEQERPHFRHELASMLAWLACHGDAPEADLVAYLIVAHHGKVRMGLRAQAGETEPTEPDRLFARGIWAGDILPAVKIDAQETVPELKLQLDLMQLGDGPQGSSWTARTRRLLSELGPFRLAWLEALVRIADWRASQIEQLESSFATESDTHDQRELTTSASKAVTEMEDL